jgi:hypothetical protein
MQSIRLWGKKLIRLQYNDSVLEDYEGAVARALWRCEGTPFHANVITRLALEECCVLQDLGFRRGLWELWGKMSQP